MSRPATTRVARQIGRHFSSPTCLRNSTTIANRTPFQSANVARCFNAQIVRSFSSTQQFRIVKQPDTSDPKPKERESNETASSTSKVEVTEERYHQLSESYLNTLVEKLEGLQEDREDVDVEYSAGVLNLSFPPNGSYVLNKQPPNKQIWLSSPITGPKRFDFVIESEGQDVKGGTGVGDWVYLRDGTALSDILLKEVGVDMKTWQPDVEQE